MAGVKIVLKGFHLIDYARRGKEFRQGVRKVMTRALNAGRRTVRQRIASEFEVRTGFLRKQARRMRQRVIVRPSEVSGIAGPVPKLMNIFEGGATLAQGRGILRPRPVVEPARQVMHKTFTDEVSAMIDRLG